MHSVEKHECCCEPRSERPLVRGFLFILQGLASWIARQTWNRGVIPQKAPKVIACVIRRIRQIPVAEEPIGQSIDFQHTFDAGIQLAVSDAGWHPHTVLWLFLRELPQRKL